MRAANLFPDDTSCEKILIPVTLFAFREQKVIEVPIVSHDFGINLTKM